MDVGDPSRKKAELVYVSALDMILLIVYVFNESFPLITISMTALFSLSLIKSDIDFALPTTCNGYPKQSAIAAAMVLFPLPLGPII